MTFFLRFMDPSSLDRQADTLQSVLLRYGKFGMFEVDIPNKTIKVSANTKSLSDEKDAFNTIRQIIADYDINASIEVG